MILIKQTLNNFPNLVDGGTRHVRRKEKKSHPMTHLENQIVNVGMAILNAPDDRHFFELCRDMNYLVKLRHRLDRVVYETVKLNRTEVTVRLKSK